MRAIRLPTANPFVATLFSLLLGFNSCSGGSSSPSPPPGLVVVTFGNGTNDTTYAVWADGTSLVTTLRPGEKSGIPLKPGRYNMEFRFVGTTTVACTKTLMITQNQPQTLTCTTRKCESKFDNDANLTLENTSTCTTFAQDYFWKGNLVATLSRGQSTSIRVKADPLAGLLRVNWAGSTIRACDDDNFVVTACEDRKKSCAGNPIARFTFKNSSMNSMYDVLVDNVLVIRSLQKGREVVVYVTPGNLLVSFLFAGTSKPACVSAQYSMNNCQTRTVSCSG